MSYRRAWLLLNDVNQSFDEPAVVTATGGSHGGGATLTRLGHELIKRYRELEKLVEKQTDRSFGQIAAGAMTDRVKLRRPLAIRKR